MRKYFLLVSNLGPQMGKISQIQNLGKKKKKKSESNWFKKKNII
jgi:hypothetical protein